jgi:hypothetical protein
MLVQLYLSSFISFMLHILRLILITLSFIIWSHLTILTPQFGMEGVVEFRFGLITTIKGWMHSH